MAFDHRALARISSQFCGVVTLHQLRSVGASSYQIRSLVRNGRYERVGTGLFVSAEHRAGMEQSVLIACRLTGGTASHETAGRLRVLRGVAQPALPHVTVPHARRIPLGPYILHRSSLIIDEHITTRRDGIRMTSGPRTAFDLVSRLGADRTESIIEQMLDQGTCTLPSLFRIATQMRSRGRAGSGLFDDVLARRPAWSRPSGSDLELRIIRGLANHGIDAPVRQHSLRLANGQVIHPDLAWPEIRFAIEVNHVTWHGRAEQSRYDMWRYRQLRLIGWHVEAVSDADIDHRLDDTCQELSSLIRGRTREIRSNLGAA